MTGVHDGRTVVDDAQSPAVLPGMSYAVDTNDRGTKSPCSRAELGETLLADEPCWVQAYIPTEHAYLLILKYMYRD